MGGSLIVWPLNLPIALHRKLVPLFDSDAGNRDSSQVNSSKKRASRAIQPQPHSPAELPAITTPLIDGLCVGGLALVVIGCVLFYLTAGGPQAKFIFPPQLLLLSEMLINGPHFMASYKQLYQKRQALSQHWFVAIVVPMVLVLFIPFAAWQSYQQPDSLTVYGVLVMTLAPLLLAWHYTGQAWGMTSCFAFLGGLSMTPTERLMIRSGLRVLVVYHLLVWWWASWSTNGAISEMVNFLGIDPEVADGLLKAMLTACRVALFAAFAVGLVGFRNLSKREQKTIPIRCWLPWVAIFGWYLMYGLYPATFVLLQIFHAIQYLIFPMRVEINQYGAKSGGSHRVRHIILYYLLLVGLAAVAFVLLPVAEEISRNERGWPFQLTIFIAFAINVHHYFIDSIIWKIRNPEVREALFGHLKPATSN